MRNQGYMIFGGLLIGLGVMLLFANLFDIDFSAVCWPTGLIVVGAWLLLRPRLVPAGTHTNFQLLGDIDRTGDWQVRDEEFWIGIGDVDLDFVHAEIPPGETHLRFGGFIGDVDLYLPAAVGLSVSAMSFVTDADILGEKRDHFMTPIEMTSPGYEAADRKIRLEANFFINDLKIRQA